MSEKTILIRSSPSSGALIKKINVSKGQKGLFVLFVFLKKYKNEF